MTALPAGLGGELYHTTGDGIFSLLLQIQGSGKARSMAGLLLWAG